MTLASLTIVALLAAAPASFKAPTGPAVEAAKILEAALQADGSVATAAKQAISRLEPHSPAAEQLQQALAGDAGKLSAAVTAVVRELRFTPKFEAALPNGFPTYTPVGAIELKRYPQYRKATSSAFWRLFLHIQTNSIAMTAPVEISYRENGADLNQTGMSFLYSDPKLGKTNAQGAVKVSDVKPQQVVTCGVRGDISDKTIEKTADRLRKWIAAKPGVSADGAMRVMGYNSPAVPTADKYYEVQIPVKVAADGAHDK